MQPVVWSWIATLLQSLELLASTFGAAEAINSAQGVDVAYAVLSLAADSASDEALGPAAADGKQDGGGGKAGGASAGAAEDALAGRGRERLMVVDGACQVLWALASVNASVYSVPYAGWEESMSRCFWACAPSSSSPGTQHAQVDKNQSLSPQDLSAQNSSVYTDSEGADVTGEDEADAWGAGGVGEGYSNVFNETEGQVSTFDMGETGQSEQRGPGSQEWGASGGGWGCLFRIHVLARSSLGRLILEVFWSGERDCTCPCSCWVSRRPAGVSCLKWCDEMATATEGGADRELERLSARWLLCPRRGRVLKGLVCVSIYCVCVCASASTRACVCLYAY